MFLSCLPSLGSEKSVCSNSSVHRWYSDNCQCTCKHFNTCQAGHSVNAQTCKCQDTPSQFCSLDNAYNAKVYLINLTVLFFVIILISTSLYWLVIKGRITSYSPNQLCLQPGTQTLGKETEVMEGYTFTLANGRFLGPKPTSMAMINTY